MATFNVTLDSVTPFSMLGNSYDWNGISYFGASAGNTAGTDTVNMTLTASNFIHGFDFYSEDPRVLNVNLTDADNGTSRDIGIFRFHFGTITMDLDDTRIDFITSFRDTNSDLFLNKFSKSIWLRSAENNTNTIEIGEEGAGSIRVESGTNTLTTGSGNVNTVSLGRYDETGTNTVTTGDGNVSFVELSGSSHTITVGEGKLRELKINDDGTTADITATNGGRIDVLRSFVTEETTFTTSNWIGSYEGSDGDDTLTLSGGAGAIRAGSGRNTLSVTDGNVKSYDGGAGVDIINVTDSGRVKFIEAGDGNNRIALGSEYTASVEAYDGDDWVRSGDGFVRSVYTGDGNDKVIIGSGGARAIDTGNGVDIVQTTDAWVNNIETSDDQDFVTVGSGGARSIGLGEGNDRVYAYEGNIGLIDGWQGNEKIYMGNVWIRRAELSDGDDYMKINKSNEEGGALISGGSGTDTLDFRSTSQGINLSLNEAGKWQNVGAADPFDYSGSVIGYFSVSSTERVIGTAFDDILTGSDPINGEGGENRLLGLGGNDQLNGLGGADDLRGGAGIDSINGGAGNDRIEGNRDADFINGGIGNDNLFGGGGGDFFIFEDVADMGFDRIKDWQDGSDQMDLSSFNFASFADVQALASDAGSDMRIDLAVGTIYVEAFQLADFDSSDVILV